MPYLCPEKHRETARKWRANNPEKCRAARRKWYADNSEKSRETTRKWYAKNPGYARDWYAKNLEKCREQARKWHQDHPEKIKPARLKHKYGLSLPEYENLLLIQNGCCAICQEKFPRSPQVDHDHKTEKTRGLLCRGCNLGLGNFKDSPERLRAAVTYLEKA